MENVIISRHPAAIEFIVETIRRQVSSGDATAEMMAGFFQVLDGYGNVLDWGKILAVATPDDVRGKRVYGNVPLSLAALAAEVVAVEFDGPAPRGVEYGLAEMRQAGARLVRYRVQKEWAW